METDRRAIRELGTPRCKSEAHRLLALLLQKLEVHAAQGEGSVSLENVRAEVNALCAPGASDFAKVYKDCLALLSDEVWEEKRQNALGRLLVRDMEEHLTRQVNPGVNSQRIPRRAITPMLNVLAILVGERFYENCYEEARHLRMKLQVESGQVSVWGEFFNRPEAQKLKTQLLVAVSRRFTDFSKRLDWVTQVMNSQLDHQVTVNDLEGRPQWTFKKHHFYTIMTDVTAPMIRFMATEGAVEKMKESFGIEGVEFLRLFLKNLQERVAADKKMS